MTVYRYYTTKLNQYGIMEYPPLPIPDTVGYYGQNGIAFEGTSCVASWAQIALNERGEVMYCCHKPYQVIGHVLDEDILEKKAAAVTDMRTCDIPCRMTAPNAFVARTMAERKDVCFI